MDIVKNLTEKLVGKDNPLIGEITKEDKSNDRSGVFYAIRKLTNAACDLYCEGDLTWDEVTENLAKAVTKLKGKEDGLMKAYQDDIKKEGRNQVLY